MKSFKNIAVVILTAHIALFSSCKDDSSTQPKPGKNGDGNNLPIEGTYSGTWELTNDRMPNDKLKSYYDKLILIVEADDSYTWTYYRKDGNQTVFKGITTHQKTTKKHSSGSALWLYSIWVDTINGTSAPGGWDGIFTFEDANTLVINVEPRVSGWPKFPTAEEGVGSGYSGQESVYVFKRK